jgi:hypothetical protein
MLSDVDRGSTVHCHVGFLSGRFYFSAFNSTLKLRWGKWLASTRQISLAVKRKLQLAKKNLFVWLVSMMV